MALKGFRAPALAVPPTGYDQRYLTELIRQLRLYFNLIDSLTPQQANSYQADEFIGGVFKGDLEGGVVTAETVNTTTLNSTFSTTDTSKANSYEGGNYVGYNFMGDSFYGSYFYGDGRYLSVPYNQFLSNQDQTGAVITATAVTFDVDDFPNSISVVSNSRITFGEKGIYLLTYSLSFTNPTNDRQEIDIWYRYKGTDIADSNSRFTMPQRKSTGANSYLIAVTPYMVDVVADGDYVEIMWRVTDATVTMDHVPAVTAVPGVTPAIPATPSAILTVQYVSAQYPPVQRVAPIGVASKGEVGQVSVLIS